MGSFVCSVILTMEAIAMGHFYYAKEGQMAVYVARQQRNSKYAILALAT
jgi:uncharacterized membrane protein